MLTKEQLQLSMFGFKIVQTKYVTFELCEESTWQEISEQLIGPLHKTKPKRRNLLSLLTKPVV